jgi:mannosylglucosylglycerate synthase
MTKLPETEHIRIGFISTRFSGTDGVSLETSKWAVVLEKMGHTCFYFSGLSDRPEETSYVVPEAFFHHPEMDALHDILFSQNTRPGEVTRQIQRYKEYFKEHLYAFISRFNIEMLIVENALSIPVNIPLGIALTEIIAESGIPTIAHHHDMYWDRQRFMVNCVGDYLTMAFPPVLPFIKHVVINSIAGSQLSYRTGLSSRLIPNVMDFDHPPATPDDYASHVREDFRIDPGEKLILQPTRIVQRKGIEHAIELVSRLEMPARLVISHAAGDEGREYEKRIIDYAERMKVPALFISDCVREERGKTGDCRRIYTLADLYPQADLVTYPSELEGFGNAFLEAIYYKRPIVVNKYSIYEVDIKPKGFNAIEFDGYISDECVRQTRKVLGDSTEIKQMVETNYRIARRHYSYRILERHFRSLITELFGD